MEVQRINVRQEAGSCNFCSRGVLNQSRTGLLYPYEEATIFKKDGSGLCAIICDDCLNELIKKSTITPTTKT